MPERRFAAVGVAGVLFLAGCGCASSARGAERGMRGSFQEAELPGVNLTFSLSAETPAGTRGTVLDHIGFEVDGLDAFCRELEARGVVFDRPYAEISALRLGVAFFTDPFGTTSN